MENYLLRQLSELGIKTGPTGAVNSVYGLMQECPKHAVRVKESDFQASDVPLIQAGKLMKVRRQKQI